MEQLNKLSKQRSILPPITKLIGLEGVKEMANEPNDHFFKYFESNGEMIYFKVWAIHN